VGADWAGADWPGSDWVGADWVVGADWFGSDWVGADWFGADWAGADWAGADWAGADGLAPDWAARIASTSCAFFIVRAPLMPSPPAICLSSGSSLLLSPPPLRAGRLDSPTDEVTVVPGVSDT
jgi:hypothetical protein